MIKIKLYPLSPLQFCNVHETKVKGKHESPWKGDNVTDCEIADKFPCPVAAQNCRLQQELLQTSLKPSSRQTGANLQSRKFETDFHRDKRDWRRAVSHNGAAKPSVVIML